MFKFTFTKKHLKIKLKRIFIVVSTIFLGILMTYLILSDRDAIIELKYYDDVKYSVMEVGKEYDKFAEGSRIYNESMFECSRDILQLASYYYEKNGFNAETKDGANLLFAQYGLFYYYKGGIDKETGELKGTMYNDSRQVCDLTKEQIAEVIEKKDIIVDDVVYSCEKVGDEGYLIFMWGEDEILNEVSIADNNSDIGDRKTVVRINSATGIIEDSDEANLIGTNFNDLFNISDLKKLNADGELVILNDGKIAFLYADMRRDDVIICSYMYFADILYMYIRTCSVPILLGWITLLSIMGYVLKFNRIHTAEEKSEIAYLHIYKDVYTDGRLVYHTIALGIFAIIVVSAATLYLHSLINYSDNSTYTKKKLTSIENVYNLDNTNENSLYFDYLDQKELIIEGIANYYLNYPEQLKDSKNLLEMKDKFSYIDEITFFDNTGTIDYDTSGHVGYTISKDESSAEYALWDILDEKYDMTSYVLGGGTYYAGRRQDKDGIIRIVYSDPVSEKIYKYTNMSEILQNVNVRSDIRGYIDLNDPEKLYYYRDNGKIQIQPNQFTEENLNSGHSFVGLIGEKRYLIDVSECNGNLIFLGKDIGKIYGISGIKMVLGIALVFLLQQIMILFISIRHKEDTPNKIISFKDQMRVSEDFNDLNERMMDENFRKLIRNLFIVTWLIVISLLLVDLKYGTTPILKYLFGRNWEKGFNLFSLTMILIIGLGGTLISKIIQSIIILFTSNVGARGLTIGRMTSSLMKFVFLIIIFLLILINLGVNPGTLLAGAGIAGAMLSFCAQQTVNDMLSGFLIVFENLFNIGDWITVEDFRGQVCEIGIRTTKLRIADTYKIFNNSELKKITIMEDNGKGAICLVDVAYEEDINKVIELIKSSQERYRKDIPAITVGPNVDGILELGDSGVTIRIWAHAEINMVNAVERELRRVTKNIFDENGIVIPFNQVTIHTGE